MNDDVRHAITEYSLDIDSLEDKECWEVVAWGDEIYRERVASHRWYDDYFIVSDLGGVLVGTYVIELSDGAVDVEDIVDFGDIFFVKKKQKTVDYYVDIADDDVV